LRKAKFEQDIPVWQLDELDSEEPDYEMFHKEIKQAEQNF
jgi:hypothetical protein